MSDSVHRRFLLTFRLLMAWTFIYAASHQVFDPKFSIVGFLNSTKTFHGFFHVFTSPSVAPVVGKLVAYGHLLIGLSLLVGLLVRLSSLCGAALLLMYWLAHMDWPYIENTNNFIVDYHIVYIVILGYCAVYQAGHVFGLDGALAPLQFVRSHRGLNAIIA